MFSRGPWVQEDETFDVYYLVFSASWMSPSHLMSQLSPHTAVGYFDMPLPRIPQSALWSLHCFKASWVWQNGLRVVTDGLRAGTIVSLDNVKHAATINHQLTMSLFRQRLNHRLIRAATSSPHAGQTQRIGQFVY